MPDEPVAADVVIVGGGFSGTIAAVPDIRGQVANVADDIAQELER